MPGKDKTLKKRRTCQWLRVMGPATGERGTGWYRLCRSWLPMGVAWPLLAPALKPPLTFQPLLGEPTPESTWGGDLLPGFSVLRKAAGMPMAVRGW